MAQDDAVQALQSQGFVQVGGVLDAATCAAFAERCAGLSAGAGTRCLLDEAWCAALAQRVATHATLAPLMPRAWRAVQCTYFEKSPHCNWLVPLHQDLSIPVAAQVPAAGLHGWSEKEGRWFVQPPPDVLGQLLAVRLHLDPCLEADGALRVVPGSHRCGVLAPEAAAALRTRAGEQLCEAQVGDALVMRPLALHASSKSRGQGRRRVLHFLFGPAVLPHGLQWRRF